MTNQDAIKYLNGEKGNLRELGQNAIVRAVAVKALQDVEEYRSIGTIDELKQLNYLRERYEDETYDYCGEYGTKECGCKNKLKRLEEYEKIGTVEECREARGKQIEKPANIIPNHVFALQCPICGDQNTSVCKHVGDTYYCSGCGQKLIYLLSKNEGGD